MTQRTMNVGLIGFGMIGKVHAYGYRTLPFYAEPLSILPRLKRVATSRPETAAKAGERLECESTTDFREITEDPEIDIVHICSPNGQHKEAVLSAIAHGKHIYCDKPLTVSLADALEIRDALFKTDVEGNRLFTQTTQMTFHLRFIPAIMRAKELIDAGRLGRLFQYRIAYYHASGTKAATPYKWKNDGQGGVIRDLVSHLIDLIDYLIGFPAEVFADSIVAYPTRPDRNDPQTARPVLAEDAVTLMTRGGDSAQGETCRGVIEATKLAHGYEDDLTLAILGEKGAIRFSLMNAHFLEFFDASASDRPYGGESGWLAIPSGARYEPPHTEFPSPKSIAGWPRAHAACLVNFLDAVASGRPAQPDLFQGIRVQAALEAVADSAQNGGWRSIGDFLRKIEAK